MTNYYKYLTKSWDIVGYIYKADIWCRDCMWTRAVMMNKEHGSRLTADELDYADTEAMIGEWAMLIGLDYDDETTYDSEVFPKVIFANQYNNDSCSQCERKLLSE